MVRAQARAFAWSIPGNRCRNSMMADSSPSLWKASRIAAASDSVTTNIAEAWGTRAVAGKHKTCAVALPGAAVLGGSGRAKAARSSALCNVFRKYSPALAYLAEGASTALRPVPASVRPWPLLATAPLLSPNYRALSII